jgi:hypothetical protein
VGRLDGGKQQAVQQPAKDGLVIQALGGKSEAGGIFSRNTGRRAAADRAKASSQSQTLSVYLITTTRNAQTNYNHHHRPGGIRQKHADKVAAKQRIQGGKTFTTTPATEAKMTMNITLFRMSEFKSAFIMENH